MGLQHAEARLHDDFPQTASLLAEIERLKREVAVARARIGELEARADIDPLLDILNRRGFERDLLAGGEPGERLGVPAVDAPEPDPPQRGVAVLKHEYAGQAAAPDEAPDGNGEWQGCRGVGPAGPRRRRRSLQSLDPHACERARVEGVSRRRHRPEARRDGRLCPRRGITFVV